jgi:hypothetical protein
MDKLYDLGEQQLKWASTILATPANVASLYDQVRAYELAGVWADIVPLLEPNAPVNSVMQKPYDAQRPEFRDLEILAGRATTIQNGLLSNMAAKIAFKSGRQQTTAMDQTRLNTTGYFTYAWTGGLSNSENELMGYVSNEIMKRQISRDADEIMLSKKLELLSARKIAIEAKAGKTMWSMVTEKAQRVGKDTAPVWGLADLLSSDYHAKQKAAFGAFKKAQGHIDKSGKTPAEKDLDLRQAALKYKADKEATNVVIDVNRIWDWSMGQHSTAVSDQELEIYINELQSQTLDDARVLVDKALRKIENYTRDLQSVEELAAANALNEGLKLNSPEFDEYIRNEAKAFAALHSPGLYFNPVRTDSSGNVIDLSMNFVPGGLDAYIVYGARNTKANLNEDFFNLMDKASQDKPGEQPSIEAQVLSWLNDYKDLMKELRASYPASSNQFKPDTFLPAVLNTMAEVKKNNPVDWALRTFERAVEDYTDSTTSDLRSLNNGVEQMFNRNVNGLMEQEAYDEYSHDLMRIAEVYGHFAIHFRHMNDIMDMVMAADVMLRKQTFNSEFAKEQGLKAWENMLVRTVFKHPKPLEGKFGPSFRHQGNKETWKKAAEVEKMADDLEKVTQELEDHKKAFPGVRGPELTRRIALVKRKNELERALSLGNKLLPTRQAFASKAVDKMIQIQQLKSFAWNPISGFVNFMMSWVSGAINAAGREDIMPEDYNHAIRMLLRKGPILGNATTKQFAAKVNALLRLTNMSGTLKDPMFNQSNLSEYQTWFDKHKITDPYVMMTAGDETAKAAILYALAKNTKVTKPDGTVITLWDGLGMDGMWDAETHGEVAGYGATTANGVETTRWDKFTDFVSKAQALAQPVTGETDPRTNILMKNYAFGRSVGQFRLSWIPEGYRHRFAGYSDYNYKLKRAFKGRYRTAMDIGLVNHFKLMFKLMLPKMLAGGDPYASVMVSTNQPILDSKGNPTGRFKKIALKDSKTDYANTLRNAFAFKVLMLTTTATYLLAYLATEALADDDDENARMRSFMMMMANLSARQYQDLVFYSNPVEMSGLLRGIVPWIMVPADFKKFGEATYKLMDPDSKVDFEEWLYRFSKNGLILPQSAAPAKIRSYFERHIMSYQ